MEKGGGRQAALSPAPLSSPSPPQHPPLKKGEKCEPRSGHSPTDFLMDALWRWAVDVAGVRVGPLAVVHLDGGERGLVATAPISPGDTLVAVPDAAVLTAPAARAAHPEPWGAAAAAACAPPHVELAAHLVWAAATPTAVWHAYAASLPASYALAACFSPADVAALGARAAVETAAAAVAAAAADVAAARSLLAAVGVDAPPRTVLAALCAVRSRAMHHPACPAGAMLPVGDLFNHAPPRPPATPSTGGACGACDGWHGGEAGACAEEEEEGENALPLAYGDGAHDAEKREYRVTARARFAPGHQVFLSYGALTNLDLLEHYGHVPDTNPCDTAPFDPACLALPRGAAPVRAADCFFHANGEPGWRLLAAVRAATAPRGSDRGRVAGGGAASAAGDAAALRALEKAATEALRALPPPPPASPASPTAAVAARWRRRYEGVLTRAAGAAGRAAGAAGRAAGAAARRERRRDG